MGTVAEVESETTEGVAEAETVTGTCSGVTVLGMLDPRDYPFLMGDPVGIPVAG